MPNTVYDVSSFLSVRINLFFFLQYLKYRTSLGFGLVVEYRKLKITIMFFNYYFLMFYKPSK